MNELVKLAVERVKAAFPHKKVEPVRAYYLEYSREMCCCIWADNSLAFGTGKCMNDVCDSLIAGIQRQSEVESKIIYEL
jgi:hypothetical protein